MHTPLLNIDTPLFYITNITNMQAICNKYTQLLHPPYFYIPKNIKYEKNAEYDVHPPGLPAAVRPGVGKKNMTNTQKYTKYAEFHVLERYVSVTFREFY